MSPELYPWIKALHVIAVIAWMAGLLYLPRLFVYHSGAAPGSEQSETFKIMELRLLRIIMHPAMAAAWLLGLWLASGAGTVDWSSDGWFHVKFLCVAGLTAFHVLATRWAKAFAVDQNQHSPRFYRMVNEVPALVMVAVVILAVVKPF